VATERCRWTAPELSRWYCRRGPADILVSGSVGFTAPCADLGILVANALCRGGHLTTLVLCAVRRPLQHVKFQSSLELSFAGKQFVIGFSETAVRVWEGGIAASRYRTDFMRQDLREAGPDRSFLEYFHPAGIDGLEALIPGYDLGRDLRWHSRRNNWLRFAWTRSRARHRGGATVLPLELRFRGPAPGQ